MNVTNVIDQTTNHIDVINVIDLIKPNNTKLTNKVRQTIEIVMQNVFEVIDSKSKQQSEIVMNDTNVINVIDQTTAKQQDVIENRDVIDQTTEQHSKIDNSREQHKPSTLMYDHEVEILDTPKQFLGFESCPQPSRPSLNLKGGLKTTQNNSRATPKHENQAHDLNNEQNSEFGVT